MGTGDWRAFKILESLVVWNDDEPNPTFDTQSAKVVHWSVELKSSSDVGRTSNEM